MTTGREVDAPERASPKRHVLIGSDGSDLDDAHFAYKRRRNSFRRPS